MLDDNLECNRTEFVAELLTAVAQPEIPTHVDYVRIMSLQKSSGLRALVIVGSGCVEELLPRRPDQDMTALQAADQIEEQRRLFYVGITRVKAAADEGKPDTLVLTYAQEMPFADAMQAGIQPEGRRNRCFDCERFHQRNGCDRTKPDCRLTSISLARRSSRSMVHPLFHRSQRLA